MQLSHQVMKLARSEGSDNYLNSLARAFISLTPSNEDNQSTLLLYFHLCCLLGLLTLYILETPKVVLLQTVKTQMKCRIMRHFIWVYTVCGDKKDPQTKDTIFFLQLSRDTLDNYYRSSPVYCIKSEGRIHKYTKGKRTSLVLFRVSNQVIPKPACSAAETN